MARKRKLNQAYISVTVKYYTGTERNLKIFANAFQCWLQGQKVRRTVKQVTQHNDDGDVIIHRKRGQ